MLVYFLQANMHRHQIVDILNVVHKEERKRKKPMVHVTEILMSYSYLEATIQFCSLY